MGSVNSPLPLDIKFCRKEEINQGLEGRNCRWQGGLRARMAIKASKVWEMVGDFCGIHMWAPSLESCKLVQGHPNEEGCVRYCEGKRKSPQGEPMWVKEELLILDCEKLLQSYKVIDSNMDLQGYSATIRVLECENDCAEIEWFFELNPIIGKDENQAITFMTLSMASKIQFLYDTLSKQCSQD